MGRAKSWDGYRSFSYLEPELDFKTFDLARQVERVPAFEIPLSADEEKRVDGLVDTCLFVSMHEHVGVFPDRIEETPEYVRHGRMATAFQGLAASQWDAVFDNLMDGICTIHSTAGWQWDDVLHDLGMRLCDLAHQDFLLHCLRIGDVQRARDEGRWNGARSRSCSRISEPARSGTPTGSRLTTCSRRWQRRAA